MSIKNLFRKFRFKSFRTLESNADISHCLNCQTPLSQNAYYCPQCGQQKHISKITIWTLIGEFFSGLFNLESGIYKSALRIFYPAYLCKEFFMGRRKSYLNPIRFFLVTLIAQFGLLSTTYDLDMLDTMTQNQIKSIAKKEMSVEFERWIDSINTLPLDQCPVDSIQHYLFTSSLNDIMDFSEFNISFTGVILDSFQIKRADFYQMPMDELTEKYNVRSSKEKFVVKQVVRTLRDLRGAIRFAIGNLIWSILFAIFVTALFLKLLYIRRKHFYVEHVILLFDIHTFSFIAVSISILLAHLVNKPWNQGIAPIPYGLAAIFFFVSMKKYYNQGFFKTLIKYFMTLFFYTFTLVFMIVIVFFASLLFYR